MEWPPEFPQDPDSDPRWLRRWLRNLRLHKYEQSLVGLQPDELLNLDDEDLQRLGIDTVGARNKFLRVSFHSSNLHCIGVDADDVLFRS